MRILGRPAGHCREPPVGTVEARLERAPASNGRMLAGRSLLGARPARAGSAHRARISSRRRDRVVAASDGPETLTEYQRMWSQLPEAIEDLSRLPAMTDQTMLATLAVLTRILPPAGFTDANLSALVICRAVTISLGYGNTDASCAHYAWLGRILAGRFGDYQAADKFGRLACDWLIAVSSPAFGLPSIWPSGAT